MGYPFYIVVYRKRDHYTSYSLVWGSLRLATIIPTYSCNFCCIGDNNVHNTHSDYYTGEEDIASADFASESTRKIATIMDIFTIITIFEIIHYIYHARECSIIPELFSLKLQPIILKIMPAY